LELPGRKIEGSAFKPAAIGNGPKPEFITASSSPLLRHTVLKTSGEFRATRETQKYASGSINAIRDE
jgi:hypothetical protein